MIEPATPRWDRNQWYPEYQEGFEFNPELAAMFREELELDRKRQEKDEVRYPISLTKRKKMSWE